jgi:hypothetical protein
MSTTTPATAPPTYAFDLGRAIVFDLETYPDHWCVGFYGPDHNGTPTTVTVIDDRDKLKKVLDKLSKDGRILVGFNSQKYDIPLMRAILKSYDPYPLSQRLIRGDDMPFRIHKFPELPCDHIDLCARVRRGGRFPSLKAIAANLGRPVLQELPYPPDAILDPEQWAEVLAYNQIDLGHTWALLERFAPELAALAALSEEQDQDLRSISTPQVVERVFKTAYHRQNGIDPDRPEKPPFVVYRPVSGVVRPQTAEAAAWHDQVVDHPLPLFTRNDRHSVIVPKAQFAVGKLTLSAGAGGLHSVDKPGVYYATRKRRLISVDVSSFYPSLIAAKGITPQAYGDTGAATYQGILKRRLEIKAQAKETSDPAERERLDIQATALKLVLNSTFGKLGDSFSSLFDPAAFITVTISGQLMLIDLIERLTAIGVPVVSANTDGLFIRPRRTDDRWREVLVEWQADTAMTLEIEPLKRLAILASNRFATLDNKGAIKRRGAGLKNAFSPLAAPNSLVVADAVVAALLRDVPPERTIRACDELVRFCHVTRRSVKVIAAALVDIKTGDETELPKVARWYRARESPRKIVHRLEGGRATTPTHADSIGLALDIESGRLPADLDYAWYEREARRTIQKVPGYRHRSRRRLEDHTAATRLLNLGLLPIPKRCKRLPPGSDQKRPTLLWDWSSYPTCGTYTGPDVGVLVVDVDDPTRFHKWIEKDNDPLLANRWRDLDGCLVAYHGASTAEGVRASTARGKLIFRFVAEAEHPLAKLPVNRWLPTRGIEVFYGRGLPSVVGEYGEGDQYQIDGTLGEPPSWLIEGLIPAKRQSRATPDDNGHAENQEPQGEADRSALDGLLDRLAKLDPRLSEASVGWHAKDMGDDRTIWVGRCPFEHDSGASSDADLAAGFNTEGLPWIQCAHASCTAIPEIAARLRPRHQSAAAEAGPKPSSNGTGATHEAEPGEYEKLSDENLGIVWADAIEAEPVAWEWADRIARGKLNLFAGEGGEGKSQAAIAIAATISTGGTLPGANSPTPQGRCLILAAEDGAADTIKPRLVAAGADCSRVAVLTARASFIRDGKHVIHPVSLQDLDYWRGVFRKYPDVRLLIADPLPAYLGRGVNDHRNNELRAVLEPFGDLLGEFGVALLAISHLGKSVDVRTPVHKILGSVAYSNMARTVHLTFPHPDDAELRVFCQVKNNLTPKQPTLSFKIVEHRFVADDKDIRTSRVEWKPGTVDITAAEAVAAQREGTRGRPGPDPRKTLKVAEWLFDYLKTQSTPPPLGAVLAAAGEAGCIGKLLKDGKWSNRNALDRAAEKIAELDAPRDGHRVEKFKAPNAKKTKDIFYWQLVTSEEANPEPEAADPEDGWGGPAPF